MQFAPRVARPAVVAALAASAFAISAAPANAEIKDKCVQARQDLSNSTTWARTWIGMGDWLAGIGADHAALQASDVAGHYVQAGNAALNNISAYCS